MAHTPRDDSPSKPMLCTGVSLLVGR